MWRSSIIIVLTLGTATLASEPTAEVKRLGDAWTDPDNPIRVIFKGERLDLWSLKTPVRPEVPDCGVRNADFSVKTKTPAEGASTSSASSIPQSELRTPRSPVDAFIHAKLLEHNLAPSPEADRRTLIRRLSFDLLGLPPTPDEVAEFLADPAPDAFERLVDRLLAHPEYGVRQARRWLDVVRYADTNGFERDEFRPTMWRFRDYVVRSFNADKPFDQFVIEQLAGDELVANPQRPESEEDVDRLIATGYLRLGPYDSTGELFQENAKNRDELMADLANTTGAAFLGQTLSCCQCHDHKYDPLSQADHFRMRAFFAGVTPKNDLAVEVASAQDKLTAHNKSVEGQIAAVRKQIAALLAPLKKKIASERRSKFEPEIVELLKTKEAERDDATKEKLKSFLEQLNVNDNDAVALLSEKQKPRHEELSRQISELEQTRRSAETAFVMTDTGKDVPATHLFEAGDFRSPREVIEAGFFSVREPYAAFIEPGVNGSSSGRRLTLAKWIVSPGNPWTARVLVNRLWQQHFGRGLVATANDFGFSGARPSHPELLDWLAVELSRDKSRETRAIPWEMKRFHRLLVSSATYRRASSGSGLSSLDSRLQPDPDNHLLWRQNPQRLDAETLRDAMLAVSGRLIPSLGGKPLWPPVAEEILLSQPGILEAKDGSDGGRMQGWYPDSLEATDVRSLFLIQKRMVPIPFLQPFDLPETTCSCAKRNVTTVAPQALTLFNSETTVRLSQAFAERLTTEAGDDLDRQLTRGVQLALGRSPDEDELKTLRDLAAKTSLAEACRVLLNLNEFVYVD